MKIRVREMEAEAAKLREMQERAEKEMDGGGDAMDEGAEGDKERDEADARSIYVGNVSYTGPFALSRCCQSDIVLCLQVDYGASPEEIQSHFQSCGTINRVTILCDKFTGHPKG
jgi:polyadenylate-binding protein 2